MKYYIISFLLLISFNSFSQLKYADDGQLYFDQMYDVDMPKDDLKNQIIEWMKLYYKENPPKIEKNDGGEIIARGVFEIPYTYNQLIKNEKFNYAIKIRCEDGNYSLVIDEIDLQEKSRHAYLKINSDYYSFEEFKKNMLSFKATANAPMENKTIEGLSDEEIFEQRYEEAKQLNNTIKEGIIKEIKSITEALDLYMNKSVANY